MLISVERLLSSEHARATLLRFCLLSQLSYSFVPSAVSLLLSLPSLPLFLFPSPPAAATVLVVDLYNDLRRVLTTQ